MTVLQPSRIKNRQSKIMRFLSVRDMYELVIVVTLGFLLAFSISKALNVWKYLWLVLWTFFCVVGLLLIIPSKTNNCKMYVLLWRMMLYWCLPKKYGKNAKRSSSDLNPYSCLISESIVKNKSSSSHIFGKNNINNYFSVFRLNGINIWQEDADTQQAFVENFANALASVETKISFVKLEEKIDFSKNLKYIKHIAKKKESKNDIWEKYYESNIEDFNNLKNNELVNNYYLIVNANSLESLTSFIETIEQKFSECNILMHILENKTLINFLSQLNLFNVDAPSIEHFMEIQKYGEEGSLDELFVYDNISFKGDHFELNDKFYRALCINKLPFELSHKWIKVIFDAKGTVIWNNFCLPDSIVYKHLDRSILASIDNSTVNRSATSNVAGSLDEKATFDTIYQIQKDGQRLFSSNVFILCEAENLRELNNENRIIKNTISKANITMNRLKYRQFFGLMEFCQFPFSKLEKENYWITSYNLALGWPFENDILNDSANMLLGKSELTQSPLSFKLFKLGDGARTNFNMFILGTSGKGKTTFTKKMIVSLLSANNKVIVVDPQAEYIDLAQKLNGQVIDLGVGKNTVINPLQIRYSLKDSENDIDSVLNAHLNWLESFFKLVINFNVDDWILFQYVLKNFYRARGVLRLKNVNEWDNQSWPLISDLIAYMKSYDVSSLNAPRIKSIALKRLVEQLEFLFTDNGKYEKLFNGYTNIKLNNDFVVFNTSNLDSKSSTTSAKVGTLCLLNFINEIVYANAQKNEQNRLSFIKNNNKDVIEATKLESMVKYCALVIDEAHLYVDKNNPSVLEAMRENTKTFRKFYAGNIFTTQNPGDFSGEDAIKIVENCQYSMFFGLKDQDIEAAKLLFKNSNQLLKSEVRFLVNAKYGKCLLNISSNQRVRLNLYYSDIEKKLFFKYV
ncbi:DUF87 domain-containing protein [Mycoplasmopsis mucosicanis]|uniref:DUF87 domain-containing protein n=1 Tax=Mycoplasmopsis mucosicanis TaxID=458208 RepID=A0A507SXV1_9BACT|nr:DUF87 domain-containing protein [Mycoplasmopsis mucosicanis]TQC54092.1 DUF87 domain-containing protein [Mycoplasmopsis mucosicanis]